MKSAMSRSPISLVLVALFAVGESTRREEPGGSQKAGSNQEYVKCNAEASGVGMSITWGVPRSQCMAMCGPTSGDGFTYEYQFIKAFSVNFDQACGCFAGGQKVVQFRPVNKAQALKCSEGDSMDIKKQCWKAYKKARGTRLIQTGSRSVPRYSTPFSHKDFVVNKMCRETCEEESCNQVTIPGALHGMDSKDKAELGRAIKDIMDGNATIVSRTLQELIAILPESDLDDAEFTAIDTDNNGKLSKDELADFYSAFTPDQIMQFVAEVDANDNGEIDPDEFQAFKEAMRNFNPDVQLATGNPIHLHSDGNGVVENKPQWKAVAVECMKNGKPAPGECEGTAEEAIKHFDMNC